MADFTSLGYIYHNGQWYDRSGNPLNTAQALPVLSSAMPSAASLPGISVYVTDMEQEFYSNGTRWLSKAATFTLGNQNTIVTIGATTAETEIHSITPPDWLMGVNDRLSVEALGSFTGSTNAKTFRVRAGGLAGTAMSTRTETGATTVTSTVRGGFANRNSKTAQVTLASAFVLGSSTSSRQAGTFDTGTAITYSFTGQKASSGETFAVEEVFWTYHRGL